MKAIIKQFFLHGVGNRFFSFRIISKNDYNELKLFRDSNIGLYAIDQKPKDVDYKWIIENNFRIT